MSNRRNLRKHPSSLWSHDELREKIISWHDEGKKQIEIGQLLGMSSRTRLTFLLQRLRIDLVWMRRNGISSKQRQAMEKLSAFRSQAEVAKAFDVSRSVVSRVWSAARARREKHKAEVEEINVTGLKSLLAKVLYDGIKSLGDPDCKKREKKQLLAWFRENSINGIWENNHSYLKFSDVCGWLDFDADAIREGLKKRGLL